MTDCQICYDGIDDACQVKYQIDGVPETKVSLEICGHCVKQMLQSRSFGDYLQSITSLTECSKGLKALLEGQEGVPTRLYDQKLFPSGPLRGPHRFDSEFGRNGEVDRLWIGGHEVSSWLDGAPRNREEIRKVLSKICVTLRERLLDCDDHNATKILTLVNILQNRLSADEKEFDRLPQNGPRNQVIQPDRPYTSLEESQELPFDTAELNN